MAHRIDNATAAAALPAPQPVGPNPDGFFQNQTIVDRDWANALQEEVCGFIEAQGIMLDKTERDQLLAAIKLQIIDYQWIETVAPTYVAGNQFSVATDLTAELHFGRRVRCHIGSGYVFGTIVASSFSVDTTTVTVVFDAAGAIDATLDEVRLSIQRADNNSTPFANNLVVSYIHNQDAVNKLEFTDGASGFRPKIDQTGENVGVEIEQVTLHNGQVFANIVNADQFFGEGGTSDAITGSTSGPQSAGVHGRNITLSLISTPVGVRGTADKDTGYDFYASGAGINYGPFTGGHDGLVEANAIFDAGDIIVDVRLAHRHNISNTIFINELSSAPVQKAVVGVAVGPSQPLGFYNTPAALQKMDPREYMDLAEQYDRFAFNAVGEGQVNVCGEGGDISAGDLIVTSSIRGKGMKQQDDIVRAHTVAKARESVSFGSPDEVKQIACIYLCG
jgi:hypothetical protein